MCNIKGLKKYEKNLHVMKRKIFTFCKRKRPQNQKNISFSSQKNPQIFAKLIKGLRPLSPPSPFPSFLSTSVMKGPFLIYYFPGLQGSWRGLYCHHHPGFHAKKRFGKSVFQDIIISNDKIFILGGGLRSRQ